MKKFKVSPFTKFMHILVYIVVSWLISGCISRYIETPIDSARPFYIFAACIFATGLLIQFINRNVAFSTIYIDPTGIRCKCFLSKDIFISWDECYEIGITFSRGYNRLGSGVSIFWLYFSTLPIYQGKREERYPRMDSDYILLQCSKAAFDEVLKYVAKDKIKGLPSSWDANHEFFR